MVTADISQLAAECSTWRQHLRNYREEFTQLKNHLRQIARSITQKDQLTDLDHFENQFYLQLINIHDLKHSIRAHDLKATAERTVHHGQVSATTWAEHEHLLDDYQRLEHMLQELKTGFRNFLARLN